MKVIINTTIVAVTLIAATTAVQAETVNSMGHTVQGRSLRDSG